MIRTGIDGLTETAIPTLWSRKQKNHFEAGSQAGRFPAERRLFATPPDLNSVGRKHYPSCLLNQVVPE